MPRLRNTFFGAVSAALLCLAGGIATAESASVESQVWRYANQEDTVEVYELFIFTYPDSELVEIAQERVAALREQTSRRDTENQIFGLVGSVTFDAPLQFGHEDIVGLTVGQVLESSPAYPPVEGLPEEYWKLQTCVGCHSWTQANLCTQAQSYQNQDPSQYQEKMHPFGGTFKINLRNWAENGCE